MLRCVEHEDLEWKRALPLTAGADKCLARDAQQGELAKDIAAMANTHGGLIVYGVAERPGESRADRIVPVCVIAEDKYGKHLARSEQLDLPPVVSLRSDHRTAPKRARFIGPAKPGRTDR
jgi:hypothetical protein